MIRRSAASSSGVHAANALCLSAATSEAIQPSTAWSSRSSPAGSVSGSASTASVSAAVLGRERDQLGDRVAGVQEEPAEHLVVDADVVLPGHQRARPAQYRSTRSVGSSGVIATQ